MMRKTPEKGETLTGNDRFIGFCKDLADKIADRLGITCKIQFLLECWKLSVGFLKILKLLMKMKFKW
jgi:hypothetical protein